MMRGLYGVVDLHHVIYGCLQSLCQLCACLGGIEAVALGRSGVEADGNQLRLLQHQQIAPTFVKFRKHVGSDKEFGEIAHNQGDGICIALGGKVFQQSVAHSAGGIKGGAKTEKVGGGVAQKENRCDVQVVGHSIAVDGPKTAVDGT